MGTRIERRVRAMARAVAWLPNAAGELLSDLVETAGYRVAGVPGPRRAAGARWAAQAVSGAAELAAAAVKAAWDAVAALLEAAVLTTGGLATLRPRLLLAAVWAPPAALMGAAIVIAGRAVSLAQSLLGLEAPSRGPDPSEAALLRSVFGASLALPSLRIVEGRAGLFGLNHRPFVLGNTIYLKTARPEPGLLVHEATHVWQYRHRGARYALEALLAQAVYRDAYDWPGHLSRGDRAWDELNPEAQAQMLEDHWRSGGGNRLEARGVDHGGTALAALAAVRKSRSPRLQDSPR